MPFVSIRMSGTATKEQKAGVVADVTRSLVERLGKNPAAVQIVIEEVALENYGAGGVLIADRDAGTATPEPKPAGAEPELAGAEPELALSEGDAHADPSQ